MLEALPMEVVFGVGDKCVTSRVVSCRDALMEFGKRHKTLLILAVLLSMLSHASTN